MGKTQKSKSIFFLLWFGCLIGSWSIIPYLQFLNIFPSTVSLEKIFLLITIQASILYAVVLWVTSLILPKTDLQPFLSTNPIKRIIIPGILSGVCVGFLLFSLDKWIFPSSMLSGEHPSFWIGILASLYGAINEEVLVRLFLFSFLYFLLNKIFSSPKRKKSYLLWSANILTALLFGLGHLPAAFKLMTPSGFEIFRILLGNGIPGLVFGWLYWSKGLWTAVLAHFVADLMIHVFLT